MRFLGSIDVAARQRSWEKDRDVLFDRFFEGYRRGLAEPGYAPGPPDIVLRLRADAKVPATRASLLAWGESKMQPMADVTMKNVLAGVEAFAAILRREHPDLAPGYFRVVRAGWLNIGVGSAVNPKILVRVQGPTDDPADDELLEIKKIAEFDGLGCLETPALQPTLRIIDGSKQLGRLKRKMLAAGPELVIPGLAVRGQHVRDWWLQSLDPPTVLFTWPTSAPSATSPGLSTIPACSSARAIYRTGRRRRGALSENRLSQRRPR